MLLPLYVFLLIAMGLGVFGALFITIIKDHNIKMAKIRADQKNEPTNAIIFRRY